MKKLLIVLYIMTVGIPTIAQREKPPHAPSDRIYVKIKASIEESIYQYIASEDTERKAGLLEGISQQLSGIPIKRIMFYHYYPPDNPFRILAPETRRDLVVFLHEPIAEQAIETLKKNPHVSQVSWISVARITAVPDDPKYSSGNKQWGIKRVGVEDAWDIQKGCPEIEIAILDIGFNMEHEDLVGKYAVGFDAVDEDENDLISQGLTLYGNEDYEMEDNDPSGPEMHGSRVASVAAADTDNSIGMAGVVWYNKIVPVRVGFRAKIGREEIIEIFAYDWAQGIDWVVANTQAKVIGMSIVTNIFSTDPLLDLTVVSASIDAAYEHGITTVAATGNEFTIEVFFPAFLPRVISVGAIDDDDERADFSNYGSELDLVAPGVDIYVAWKNGLNKYKKDTGTSFAQPMVAGTAALLYSQVPYLSPQEVKLALTTAAEKLPDMGGANWVPEYGFGLLDAPKALDYVPLMEEDLILNNLSSDVLEIRYASYELSAANYEVSSQSTVIFKAGESILLDIGFEATETTTGATFCAEINPAIGLPCEPGTSERRRRESVGEGREGISQISEIPLSYDLQVNPNPWAGNAEITYAISENASSFHLYIIDLWGNKVKTVRKEGGNVLAGNYIHSLAKPSDLTPGLYVLILEENQQVKSATKIIITSE